jgi:hypothetical protein
MQMQTTTRFPNLWATKLERVDLMDQAITVFALSNLMKTMSFRNRTTLLLPNLRAITMPRADSRGKLKRDTCDQQYN